MERNLIEKKKLTLQNKNHWCKVIRLDQVTYSIITYFKKEKETDKKLDIKEMREFDIYKSFRDSII